MVNIMNNGLLTWLFFGIVAYYIATSLFGMEFNASEGISMSKSFANTTSQTTSCMDYIGTTTLPERCKSINVFGAKIGG